jgi:uncharacterized membrane protein
MSARSWIGWVVATLVIAVAVHVASVWYLPHFIMHQAMARMGAVNAIHHQPRVTADSRGVVRPSPDLLYSVCPFDLTNGPLLVTAAVPQGTYWSVSVFDADTNNVFALNDRQAKTIANFLIVAPPSTSRDSLILTTHSRSVHFEVTSPTTRGLVLFRTLIASEKNSAMLDAVRRQANCKLLTQQ